MLDQPPSPATVIEQSGTLSVTAHNSSLAQILKQVSSKTGMQLEGLSGDERVFGSFGPGNPRDVLISLLDGTPYNIMMVGDLANGAPRQLVLTPKTAAAANSSPAPSTPNPPPDAEEDNSDDNPEPPPEDEVRPGDVLEQQQEQERQNNPPGASGPRTPEQLLQQLQQMRNAQQGQQPQPDDQSPQY